MKTIPIDIERLSDCLDDIASELDWAAKALYPHDKNRAISRAEQMTLAIKKEINDAFNKQRTLIFPELDNKALTR